MTAAVTRPITRVLMTADPVGGVWTYAMELARQLDLFGIEIVLATMGAPLSEAQRAEARAIDRLSLHERSFKLEWMDDPWPDVDEAGAWLLDLERETSPDVVHLSSMSHGALPWRAPVITVVHSCVLSWWEAVRRSLPPAGCARYHDRVRRGLQRADVVVAPTAAMLRTAERLYGPFSRTAVIWNTRSAEAFAPGRKEPVVFGAGRVWDEAKNLRALDRVAPFLAWPVWIAGETRAPHGPSVEIRFAEWVGVLSADAMRRRLARASIYALPARYEPFGLSAVEAALSGCALVLGDLPSLREVWGSAAVFVGPDDARALRRALEWLIDDDTARRDLAERAWRLACSRRPRAMAAAYVAEYGASRAASVA